MARKFSERIGITAPRSLLQLDEMDKALRNSLWNAILELFEPPSGDYVDQLAEAAASEFFKVPKDGLPDGYSGKKRWLKRNYYKIAWHQVYDFVEFAADNHPRMKKDPIAPHVDPYTDAQTPYDTFNAVLEREGSGYRFVNRVLTPISGKAEVAEVEGATELSSRHGLDGASTHIQAAVRLLGQKPQPDYRNAVKEAISAVESVCQKIEGVKSGGLKQALTSLAERASVHGALRSAFLKLYGYTSDKDGIRHAILNGEVDVGFDEAKFMVVACSAFVNYLIQKAATAGILRS